MSGINPIMGQDSQDVHPMYRRRILQIVASGTAFSTVGLSSGASDDDFVDVLSADPSSYPTASLNVRVDTDAGRDGKLTKDDFTVYEDGKKRPLTDFEFSSTSLDLVFVFDDSGSMDEEIAAMKREAKDLTSQIASSGIDAQYGLVSFRDRPQTDLSLTSDASKLKDAVDSLSAGGGGDFPEDNFDSINAALDLEFRDSAQKVIIDITDATSHYSGDGSGYSETTLSKIASDLEKEGIAFIAVSRGYDDPNASLKVLARKVGGYWVDIRSADFSVILEKITKVVVETYILEYDTAALPGEELDFTVSATDPERGTDEATGSVSVPEDAGPTVPPRFTELQSAKLELAGHIDEISQSLSEKSFVQETLNDLESRIKNGEVEAEQAISAVERMLMGENLTELSLGGLAPVSVSSPESSPSRVGEPSGSPAADGGADITGALVDNVLQLGVGLLFALKGFLSVAGWLSKFISRIDDAVDFLDTAIATLFGVIPFVDERVEDAVRALTGDAKEKTNNGNTDENGPYEFVAGQVQDLRDPIANDVMAGIEGGFEERLIEFDRELGLDDDDTFEFDGDDSAAEEAATNAREDVISTFEQIQKEIAVTGFVSKVGDLMAVGGALLSLGSGGFLAPLGTALAIVGTFFSLSFGFLASVAAADGLYDVRTAHNDGLDAIINGGI